MKYLKKIFLIIFIFLMMISCLNKNSSQSAAESVNEEQIEPPFTGLLIIALNEAGLPGSIQTNIRESYAEKPDFINELSVILNSDPYFRVLVDKNQSLPPAYEPDDLVQLTGTGVSYRINRNDMFLRQPAYDALEVMAKAAREDGLNLLASSAYRSYEYQEIVYSTWVRQYGQEEADTFSARPGHSQHQLGLVVDFGSITDAFADTAEGKWLAANASRFGWSLSYPKGYEHITGYKWECWHYRYVGKELAEFIDKYFDGIQQYALQFIHAWQLNNSAGI